MRAEGCAAVWPGLGSLQGGASSFFRRDSVALIRQPVRKPFSDLHCLSASRVGQVVPNPTTGGAPEQPKFPLAELPPEPPEQLLGIARVNPLGLGFGHGVPSAQSTKANSLVMSRPWARSAQRSAPFDANA